MTNTSAGPGTEAPGPGPDAESYAVLDIGGDIGALVLYAPAELCGTEIEISRAGTEGAARTHSLIRERQVPGSPPVYAAVYPGLVSGEYTVWRDEDASAGTVVVEGGQVADFEWGAGKPA
jgi:hypothetical protein